MFCYVQKRGNPEFKELVQVAQALNICVRLRYGYK